MLKLELRYGAAVAVLLLLTPLLLGAVLVVIDD